MPFNLFAFTGTNQPVQPKPPLEAAHGVLPAEPTAWTPPPEGTGQGYSDPQPVDPLMAARGINRQPAYAYGHRGTEITAAAQAASMSRHATRESSRSLNQIMAGAAHGDLRTALLQTHQYNPAAPLEEGEGQGVDRASGLPGPTMSARAVIHTKAGGIFSDGQDTQLGPVGFREGIVRRWAFRRYTSPALGAMHSREPARGVLPNTVATPHNQPGLPGPRNSGIPSNQRFLAPAFTLPQLWTQPRSESDVLMAQQGSQAAVTPVLGVGMI